ncbi:hypothetical protein ACFXTH_003208 [Malus domestica]
MSSFSLHPSPRTSLYVDRDSTVGSISRLLWPSCTGSGFVDCLNVLNMGSIFLWNCPSLYVFLIELLWLRQEYFSDFQKFWMGFWNRWGICPAIRWIGGREGNFLKDWVKGSALSATVDLEKSLHNECKRLFLTSFESYLNEVLVSKSSSMESNSHVAEMMCQIKKVGDWLEACGRVKKRFIRVFLKHVERTCMVLDHMNVVIGDRQL